MSKNNASKKRYYGCKMSCTLPVTKIGAEYVLYYAESGASPLTDQQMRDRIQTWKRNGKLPKDNQLIQMLEVDGQFAEGYLHGGVLKVLSPATVGLDWPGAEASNKYIQKLAEGMTPAAAHRAAADEHFLRTVSSVPGVGPGLAKTIEGAQKKVMAPVQELAAGAETAVDNSMDSLITYVTECAKSLKSIVDCMPGILDGLAGLATAYANMWAQMGPIVATFNREVIEPYNKLMAGEVGAVLDKMRQDLEDGNLTSDTVTPPINGPWPDPADYAKYAAIFNAPFGLGQSNRAVFDVMRQIRYEQGTARGPPSWWEMVARAERMGTATPFGLADSVMPKLATDVGQVAAQVPEWWTSNSQSPPEYKGLKERRVKTIDGVNRIRI